MTRQEEAQKLTDDAKELILLAGRSWTAYAGICARMIEEELYKDIGFTTFGAWCEEVGDKSASHSYGMAATYTELKKSIPEVAIAQMTINNAQDLTKIPEKDRTAELVEKGTRLPNNKYRNELTKAKPGIILESRSYKGFQLEESRKELVERTLKLAMENNGITGEAEALEAVCASYLAEEGSEPHLKAVKALVEKIENEVHPEGSPPSQKAWGDIVAVERRLARVFGLPERRVMPGKGAGVSGGKDSHPVRLQ